MEEIEYLEEYEDLVLPAINSTVDAAVNTQTSKQVNVDNDASSSSLDQDIFNCLFDDNSDEDNDDIQNPFKGREVLNQRALKTQSDSVDSKKYVNTIDAKIKNTISKDIEKKHDLNSVETYKSKTNASLQQNNPNLKVSNNIVSSQYLSVKERSNIANLKPSSTVIRRQLEDSTANSTSASTFTSSKSHISRQSKHSVCKSRPATIIKPEKVITKDPIEDPLNLDDLSSAGSPNFSVSDISGETYNSISDFDDDDYDFSSKIEALDENDDSSSSQIIDISNDSSESRFQFDYLRGSTPSPVVSEDRDIQNTPAKLMANHDIIKSLLTKGERPKLLQLISKQEKTDHSKFSIDSESFQMSSVSEISKELSIPLIPKESIVAESTIIKSDKPLSQTSTSNDNFTEEYKKTSEKSADKILHDTEQKSIREEILLNQEVGAEMEIGNEEPVDNIQDQITKSGNEKDSKIFDKDLLASNFDAQDQHTVNSSDIEKICSEHKVKSKDPISIRPRKTRFKNILTLEEKKEDEETGEIADMSHSKQSDNSKVKNVKESIFTKNPNIDNIPGSSPTPKTMIPLKGSFKNTSKGKLNESSRNLSRDKKDGLSDTSREVPKGVIMNPFVQRGTKNLSTTGSRAKISRESSKEKLRESSTESTEKPDFNKNNKDKKKSETSRTQIISPVRRDGNSKNLKESFSELDSTQKSNSPIETIKIKIDSTDSNKEQKSKSHEICETKSIFMSKNNKPTEMLCPKTSVASEENLNKNTKEGKTIHHSEKVSSLCETLNPIKVTYEKETCKMQINPGVDESDKKQNIIKDIPKDYGQETTSKTEEPKYVINSKGLCGNFDEKKDEKVIAKQSENNITAFNTVPSSHHKNSNGKKKLDYDKSSTEDTMESIALAEASKEENTSNIKVFESQDVLKENKQKVKIQDDSQALNLTPTDTDSAANETEPNNSNVDEPKNVSNKETQPELVKIISGVNTSFFTTLDDKSIQKEINKTLEEKEQKRNASKLPKIAKSKKLHAKTECNVETKWLKCTAEISTLNERSDLSVGLTKKDDTNKQTFIGKDKCPPDVITEAKTKKSKDGDGFLNQEKDDDRDHISINSNALKQDICGIKTIEVVTSEKKEFEENQRDVNKEIVKLSTNEKNQSTHIKNDKACTTISNSLSIRQNLKKGSVNKKESDSVEPTLKDESTIVENIGSSKNAIKETTYLIKTDTLQLSKDSDEKIKVHNFRKTRSTILDNTCLETDNTCEKLSSHSLLQADDSKDFQGYTRKTRNTKSDEEIQQNKNHIESQNNKDQSKICNEKSHKLCKSEELTENGSNQTSNSSIKFFIKKTNNTSNTECNISHESKALDETNLHSLHAVMHDNITKRQKKQLLNNFESEKDFDPLFQKYKRVDEENQTEAALSNSKINTETMSQRKGRITRNSLEPKLADNKKKTATIHDKSFIKKEVTVCGNDEKKNQQRKSNAEVPADKESAIPVNKTRETPQQKNVQSEENQKGETVKLKKINAKKDENKSFTKHVVELKTKPQKSIKCEVEPLFKISKNFRTSTPKLGATSGSTSSTLQKGLNEMNQAQSSPSIRSRNIRKRGEESHYNDDSDDNNTTLCKSSITGACQLENATESEGRMKRKLRSPAGKETQRPIFKKIKIDNRKGRFGTTDDTTLTIRNSPKVIMSFGSEIEKTREQMDDSAIDPLKSNTSPTDKTSMSTNIITDEGHIICNVSQGMKEKINVSFSDRSERPISSGLSQTNNDNDILNTEKSASCSILSFAEWLKENSNKDSPHIQSQTATRSATGCNSPIKSSDSQDVQSKILNEIDRKQKIEEADFQASRLSSPNCSRKVKLVTSTSLNETLNNLKENYKITEAKDNIISTSFHSSESVREDLTKHISNDLFCSADKNISAKHVEKIKDKMFDIGKETSQEKCNQILQFDLIHSKRSSSTKSKSIRNKIGGSRRQLIGTARSEQQKSKTTNSNRQDKKSNKRTEIDILIESMSKEMKDAGIKELLKTNSNVKRQRAVAKRSFTAMESLSTTAPAEKEKNCGISSVSTTLTKVDEVFKRSPTRRSLTKKIVKDSNKNLTATKSTIPMEIEKALIDEVEIRNMNTSLLEPLKLDISAPRSSLKQDSNKAPILIENDVFKTPTYLSETSNVTKDMDNKKVISSEANESLNKGFSLKCRKLKVKLNRSTVKKFLKNSKIAESTTFNETIVSIIQGDLKKKVNDGNCTISDQPNELQATSNAIDDTIRPLGVKSIPKSAELLNTRTNALQRNSNDLQQIVSDNIMESMPGVELKHEFLDENPNSIGDMTLPDTTTLMARSHSITQAAASALSNTIMPTDIRLLSNDPTSTRMFVPSFGVTPTLVDAKGARMYTFLHPAKYSRNHGNVLLDYCCPNLDGPMPAIDPTRIHAQVQTPVIELPSYIVLTTKVVTRAELESKTSTIPAVIRKKAEKLRSNIHQFPVSAAESAVDSVSTQASRSLHSNSTQYPSLSISSSLSTGGVQPVMTGLNSPQFSIDSPRFSSAVNALAKYLPSTTTITAKIRPEALSNSKEHISTSVSVVAKGPTILNEKQTNLLRSNLRRVDVIFKTLVQPFEKLNFSERHQIIDNLVASGKFLPKDLERTIVLMEEYSKQINLIEKKQITDTISSCGILNTIPSHVVNLASMQMPPLQPAPKLTDSTFKSDTSQNIKQIQKTAIRKLQSTTKQTSTSINSSTSLKQRQVPIYDTERNIIGYQLQMITPANTTPTYSKTTAGVSAPFGSTPTGNQKKSLKRPAQDSPRVFYTSQPIQTHPTQNANPYSTSVKESSQTIGKSQNESFVTTVHSAGTTSEGTETITTTTTMATLKRVTRSRAAGSKIIIVSKSNSSAETILPDVNQQTEIKHEKDVDDFIA